MYCTVVVFAQGPQAYCLINYYYISPVLGYHVMFGATLNVGQSTD